MRGAMYSRILIVALLLAVAPNASAQSLVELAAAERARRAEIGPAARRYSNADLRVWPAPVVKDYGPIPPPYPVYDGPRVSLGAPPDPWWPFAGPPTKVEPAPPWSVTTYIGGHWRRSGPGGRSGHSGNRPK